MGELSARKTCRVYSNTCTRFVGLSPQKLQVHALGVGFYDSQEHSLDIRCHKDAVLSKTRNNPNQTSQRIRSGNQFVIDRHIFVLWCGIATSTQFRFICVGHWVVRNVPLLINSGSIQFGTVRLSDMIVVHAYLYGCFKSFFFSDLVFFNNRSREQSWVYDET